MKNYMEYLKQIEKITKEIETKTNTIIELDNQEARRAAANNNNLEEYNRLLKEAQTHGEEISKLSQQIRVLEVESKIIFDNAKFAMINEVIQIVSEVLPQFNGKRLGTITKERLNQALNKNGKFYIYVNENTYGGTEVHARPTDQKYYYSLNIEISTYNENKFIIDNTVNMTNFNKDAFYKHCEFNESPKKTAKTIIKKWDKIVKINEELTDEIVKINLLLPSSYDRRYNKNYFYTDLKIRS